jgi:ABC-type multidrug transport system fused ATPase/permease subunit
VDHRKPAKVIYSDFSRKEILGSIVKILEDHAVEEEIARFEGVQNVLQCQRLMAASSLFFRNIPPNAGFYLGFLVMSGCVVWQVRIHERTGTDLLSLFTFMEQLLTALSSLSSSLQRMQNAFVNAERLMNTQKVQPIIGDLVGAVELTDCLGLIEFDPVQSGTLNSLTFHCEENTVTAILGLSMSEKITLWQLLFRLIDPSDGRILIDGRNVQGYMIESLRRHIAIIHQSCELRDGSIRQNIKYGLSNPDSITDSMLEHVCRRVNIHSTIMKLPGEYSYQMSRRETKLGEKIR